MRSKIVYNLYIYCIPYLRLYNIVFYTEITLQGLESVVHVYISSSIYTVLNILYWNKIFVRVREGNRINQTLPPATAFNGRGGHPVQIIVMGELKYMFNFGPRK